MPKFNVHIYTMYRLQFDVEAPDAETAVHKALELYEDDAVEIEDAGDTPASFVCDPRLENGSVDYDETQSGLIRQGEDGNWKLILDD